MLKFKLSLWFAAALIFIASTGIGHVPGAASKAPETGKQQIAAGYGKLPLTFESNQGQADPQVKFLSRGSGYALFLTPNQAVLSLCKPGVQVTGHAPDVTGVQDRDLTADVVRMRLVEANPDPTVSGVGEQPGHSNYLVGDNPAKWRTNVPHFGKVRYQQVYPGVDLVYYGTDQRRLEYDFVVASGADPGLIRLRFDGADALRLDDRGNLVLHTRGGEVVLQAPVSYQEIDGVRRLVESRYIQTSPPNPLSHGRGGTNMSSPLSGRRGGIEGGEVSFALGPYDKSLPLIIDPVLNYSTYLGGSSDEEGRGIAVDASGNAYITGYTASTNFPTASPSQAANGGNRDIFVTKLSVSGSALVYSTYIGGSGNDAGNSIAVDGAGNAYITGSTVSANFPTISPLQASLGGGADVFVAKLNASGSALAYSTYLGGSGDESGFGIAVTSAGIAAIAGYTQSTNFPTANPLQAVHHGANDAFAAKLNASGSAMVYSTYLGGTDDDEGNGIVMDASGNAYVTGSARSTNFPTVNAIQGSQAGNGDAFVTKLDAPGASYYYSTYIGGNGSDYGQGIAVDGSGNAYITGYTGSSNFPVLNENQSYAGNGDAFVTRLNASGSSYLYSTFLGGTGTDQGGGIAADGLGAAYVAGQTSSSDFPTFRALQASFGGGSYDAFVTKIAPSSGVSYSTYVGGSNNDYGLEIAVYGSGSAYLTGYTNSSNFPAQGPMDATLGGAQDAFVARVDHVTFTEVGAAAGVDESAQHHGVAWGDYDNDGDQDLFVSSQNNGTNRLYRNNGNGVFSEVGSAAGVASLGDWVGVAWGDYDNDGDLDLYVASDAGPNLLYRNNGNGTFTEVGAAAGADDPSPSKGVAWGDYDGDGFLDLYVVNAGSANRLYKNNGNGTFTDVAAAAGVNDGGNGRGAAWGDYDGDGDLDLYVANAGSANRLYRNNGDGTFTEVGGVAGVDDGGAGNSVSWGDYDNDGDLDVYLTNNGAANRLYRNNGNGTFTEVGASAGVNNVGNGVSAGWGDYDNDGDLDIYLSNHDFQVNLLYRNNGNGTFAEVGASAGVDDANKGRGVAWGDYNDDGFLDLFLANDTSFDRLYRNNGSASRWLHVKLVGTVSNRSGIGARVTAVTGSLSQRRDVDGGSGSGQQPSLPVEFGVGGAMTMDEVTVLWPSGIVQTLTGVATNQVITVTEPANRTPTVSVPSPQTVNENDDLTFTVTATDPDVGQVVTFSATGLPTGATFDTDTGAFSWTPGFTQAGVYTVNFTATDNGTPPLSDGPKSVTITVNNVNVAPSFTAGANQAVNEDAGAQSVAGWATVISDGDPDVAQALTFEVTNDNNALFLAQPAVDASGNLTYTPGSNANGTANVTVALHDNGGTANGGVDTSPPQTFTITMSPVNDAPSFTKGPDQTVFEDAGPQAVIGWATDLSAGPANESGQALDFLVASDNPGLFSAQPSVDASGKLTYTPAPNANGTANVTVRIHDDGGTASGGVDTSAPQTFKITVTPVNDPPTADAGPAQTVDENTPVTLHGSGSDVEDPVSQLSFAWTQTGGPSVTLSGANTATPTFTAPFVPMDGTAALTFQLVVTDNGSPALSSQPSTVTITVRDVYNAMYMSVHGASSIRKDLRDEDVMKFRRDDNGQVIDSTLERFFDGSQYFKSNEALDGVDVGDFDGDAELELIFSVRSKANFKMGNLEVRPGDLVMYNPSSSPKFTRFLDGSKVFVGDRGKFDRDRENIDGVSVHKTGSSWKVFLTTTGKAQIGTLAFDRDDVIRFDFDPATSAASNPARVLDAMSLFRGKQANLDALDVVDDDGNGTCESIAFSTGSGEKLKDGREIRASVVYAYNLETDAVNEVFDPVADGLSKGRVPIGSVSFIGPLRPWGAGPRPTPASKPKSKGHALMAKVGEDAPEVPEAFGLETNYPNPFNPATTVRYALPEASNVSLVVYNILGQQVRTLVNGAQGPGYHSVVWDGRDEAGRMAATGVYIYRLQAGAFTQVKKMLFAK